MLFPIPLALVAVGTVVERAHLFPGLRFAVQRTAEAMPSTGIVAPLEVGRGFPLLSVSVDPHDLYDPTTGLFPNKLKHGRDWERPATVSYFDGGRLVFASGAGLRIHGDLSRKISPVLSYRLYFRRAYGASAFTPGVLFDRSTEPLRQLVLDNDVFHDRPRPSWHFTNPLAYDIARAMGCLTVQTKPVRLFLNGEFQGVYVLTERISDPFLVSHFGHSDFNQSNRSYDELLRVLLTQSPLTMDKVARVVDLDNLTRWFLSVLFCATEDTYQGPQLRDETRPGSRWFWINWDMDHSFLDFNQHARVPWEHDTFQWVLERIGEKRRGRQANEPRALIFTALLAEDPHYRDYFKTRFVEVMNYRVTPTFLAERYEYYRHISETYGTTDREYLPIVREFLARRPAILRDLAEQYLNTEPSVRCTVKGAASAFTIDGFSVPNGFSGYYFPNMAVEIGTASPGPRVAYWVVDGARVQSASQTLRVTLVGDTTVEAVFDAAPTPQETASGTGAIGAK